MACPSSNSPLLPLDQLQERLDRSPFGRWLGMAAENLTPHGLDVRLRFREDLIGSVLTGAVHGGILGCLVDSAGAFALIGQTGQSIATIDYRINFHRPWTAGSVTARARILHSGSRLATVNIAVVDASDRLVASGQGMYQHVALVGRAAPQRGAGD